MYSLKLAHVVPGQLFRNQGNLYVRLDSDALRVLDVGRQMVIELTDPSIVVQVGRVAVIQELKAGIDATAKKSKIDLSRDVRDEAVDAEKLEVNSLLNRWR